MAKNSKNQGNDKAKNQENTSNSQQKTGSNFVKHIMNKIMVLKGGSPAIHKLGDISRDEDDFIVVYAEDGDKYIGQFKEGYGFIDVHFNKSDVRPCTKEEIDELNKKWFGINGHILGKNHYNYEGEPVEVKSEIVKGRIIKVMAADKEAPKHKQFWGLEIQFDKSLLELNTLIIFDVLDENAGRIQTTTVTGISYEAIDSYEKGVKITTLNSVFYIGLY
jgi:hypothetical protein